jgi:hypothetical protein
LPPLFSTRPPAVKLVLVLVAPAIFGAVAGVLLGVSAPAYWALQVLGAVGGFFAGLEHPTAADGAERGVLGGAVFGSFLLLAHAIIGADAKVSLGEWPGVLIVFTTIAGGVLGALGGGRRAAWERPRQDSNLRPTA